MREEKKRSYYPREIQAEMDAAELQRKIDLRVLATLERSGLIIEGSVPVAKPMVQPNKRRERLVDLLFLVAEAERR